MAALTLVALLIVILLSCLIPKLNPGILALAAAVILGTGPGNLTLKQVLAGFPVELCLLLIIVCLVFGIAQVNGTLPYITQTLVARIHGRILLLPLLVFFLSFCLSALGPGNIAAVALLAPLAMSLARQYQISYLLIAIMLATGANAGAFSPFAPTGVVASGLMADIGLPVATLRWTTFYAAASLQALTALGAYLVFLIRRSQRVHNGQVISLTASDLSPQTKLPFNRKHKITIALIAAMLASVLFTETPLFIAALVTVIFLTLFKLGEPEVILKDVPWSTILMVSGIAILIGLAEATGGLELATHIIASATQAHYINATLALVTGLISAFSSSSGVVMPAFIPLIPGLADKLHLANQVQMVIAVSVGSHLVDVSPFSTLGALAIAAVPIAQERPRVFRLLLIWGMSMALVGAFLAFVSLDLLS